jgi:hypothetical protein
MAFSTGDYGLPEIIIHCKIWMGCASQRCSPSRLVLHFKIISVLWFCSKPDNAYLLPEGTVLALWSSIASLSCDFFTPQKTRILATFYHLPTHGHSPAAHSDRFAWPFVQFLAYFSTAHEIPPNFH